MWIISAVFVLLTFPGNPTEAKFVFEFNDDFEPCQPDVPMPALNLSRLVFSTLDSSMAISGTVSFDEDYDPPVRLNINSLHKERGSWRQGDFVRTEMNICGKLMSPWEPWFSITRHFKQKGCPFKAGHEEVLSAIELGDLGIQLPASFAGDWKFFVEFEPKREGRKVKECFSVTGAIVEV